mmetsp:Transcript_22665/g.50613  ORF Transcript_22665/g.50613 Transcript_22665/m.50613 type:complete len:1177 (+) Transcript_22665:27-3557(+)
MNTITMDENDETSVAINHCVVLGDIPIRGNANEQDEEDGSSRSGMWGEEHSSSNETGVSPTTNNGSQPSKGPSEESLNIAKKEDMAVYTWRLIMFGVLISTTITIAILVYKLARKFESTKFETSFEVDSQKIYESLGRSMDTKLQAVDALAMLMVSSARLMNETWPYTLLPDFASKAAKMRVLSHAIALQQYQYVVEDQRSEWEAFAKANEGWVQETIEIQRNDTIFGSNLANISDYNSNFSTSIRYGGPVPNNTGPYTPTWQTYPMLPSGKFSAYNFNAIQHKLLGPGIEKVLEEHKVVIGPVLNFEDSIEKGGANRVTIWAGRHVEGVDPIEPVIRVLYPILDSAVGAITIDEDNSTVVGMLASSFFWRSFLVNILPEGENGLVVVFENTYNQTFTYEINGHKAVWLGPGDNHDTQFDGMGKVQTFQEIGLLSVDSKYGGLPIDDEFCAYTVSTYPSEKMKNQHVTNQPLIFTLVVVSISIFTALVFVGYDKLVSRRQQMVMKTAVQSTTIVSSLFPSNVRDRLLEGDVNTPKVADKLPGNMFQPNKTRLRTFLNNGEPSTDSNKPIADLFTDTTVLFADIAGFTAWSSVREPTQVFTLLETVYGAFDHIANKRGVFKVETIGDSYVAVTGLPDPRTDHAVVMAKFARDCRQQFNDLCSALESTLGPETGDLHLRIGLHSGPVTAGVLRGQKSRFQLFGDTVNTAARMESTGKVNKIQVSQVTADLLKDARKSQWLQPREEAVEAKGKGLMITYWVEPKSHAVSSTNTSVTRQSSADDFPHSPRVSSQTERLINWNIDVLERLLKKIVARRVALKRKSTSVDWRKPHENILSVLDEVQEVIKLPEYDSKYATHPDNPDSIVLEPRVCFQLREFVTAIALTYHENPFHNFPHASHVGMSVAKLLSRIVAPDKDFEEHEQLHDHTYGITSDPLTQFACVFSALIHDADHPGVPNIQLVKEDTEMAKAYEGKSIAEQNSINLAWNILVEDKYSQLRKTICKTQQEEWRFRQLVVNAVCATDIMDKDLKSARNQRWEKAFSTAKSALEVDVQEQINRKATIVIEHIIQASDVAHTMQHWHIYIKWNERLYAEMYKAFIEGRAEKDPTESWYKGELGFFDFYIIPLAQKLSECGVFGVSSDEYLNYALMNRNEWEKKGMDVVANFEKKHKKSDRTVEEP